MNSMTKSKPGTDKRAATGRDLIAHYAATQSAGHAAICRALRAEIDAALPEAASEVWHGSPVWFIGENPVVGYNVTPKDGVSLLFWNGQSFGEPALKPAGRFHAAQVQFTEAAQIDSKPLRRWLKKAGTDVWDARSYFLVQVAARKARRTREGGTGRGATRRRAK